MEGHNQRLDVEHQQKLTESSDPTVPRGAKLWSPSALSGSDVITLALRFPSAVLPGPESKNFMMVDTMLRAVFTIALVLVTMLLQINCTPPGQRHNTPLTMMDFHLKDKDNI